MTFAWQALEAQSITGWGEHLSPEAKTSWNDGEGGPLIVPESWEDQPPQIFPVEFIKWILPPINNAFLCAHHHPLYEGVLSNMQIRLGGEIHSCTWSELFCLNSHLPILLP